MGLAIKGALRTLSDLWVLGQVQTGFEAPGQCVGKGPLLTRAFWQMFIWVIWGWEQ